MRLLPLFLMLFSADLFSETVPGGLFVWDIPEGAYEVRFKNSRIGRNFLLKQGKALRFNKDNQELVDARRLQLENLHESMKEEIELDDVAEYAPITLHVGYGLIPLVDPDGNGPLVSRVTSIRKRVSQELGFIIPPIRIRDDLTLKPNQYRLKIGETIVGEDLCYPDKKLAIAGDTPKIKIRGEEVTDPSFGLLNAHWPSVSTALIKSSDTRTP